jgi:hypothetical protein
MNGARNTTVMLAIVLGVLVASAGVFTTLFLIEHAAARDVGGQVTATEQELAGERDLLAHNRSTMDELASAEQDLVDANAALHACADPTKASIAAVRADDDQALSDAIDQMLLHCGR